MYLSFHFMNVMILGALQSIRKQIDFIKSFFFFFFLVYPSPRFKYVWLLFVPYKMLWKVVITTPGLGCINI